jgi:hypothetical protein
MADINEDQLKQIAVEIHKIIEKINPESAVQSLGIFTLAFGLVLDVYVRPNEENPKGMCDSTAAFRQYFADILTESATTID